MPSAAGRSAAGRPKVSSREVLAEAACELFLERGYDATSIVDITRRAGVSRSSFFNYFSSKGDVLWSALDERIAALAVDVAGTGRADAVVQSAVAGMAQDFAPESLALALANAEAMGLADELQRESALRRARIAVIVADRLRKDGEDALRSEVVGAAYAGAVLAAVQLWATASPGRTLLSDVLARALAHVRSVGAAQTEADEEMSPPE